MGVPAEPWSGCITSPRKCPHPHCNYPDCQCIIVLTRHHLYVLENNFDGTYETHFEFVISEIDAVEEQTYADNSKVNIGMPSEDLMAVLSSILGIGIGIPGVSRVSKKRYMVIHYHNELGNKERIYFTEYSGVRSFIKEFNKVQQSYRQGNGW